MGQQCCNMKSVTFSSAAGASKVRKLPEDATFADVAHILADKYGENYKFKFFIHNVLMEAHDHIPDGACVTVMRRALAAEDKSNAEEDRHEEKIQATEPQANLEAKEAATKLNSRKWYGIHGMPARFRRIDKDNNLTFLFDLGYNAQRAKEIEGTLGESGDDCHDYKEQHIQPSVVHEIMSSHCEVCEHCRYDHGREGRRFRLASKGCIHGMCGHCCSVSGPLRHVNEHLQPLACPRHHANIRQQQMKLRQYRKHL